jgi:hypothetical protein
MQTLNEKGQNAAKKREKYIRMEEKKTSRLEIWNDLGGENIFVLLYWKHSRTEKVRVD